MAQDELPQTYLITPSDFDQTVLCDDLARVLDAHPYSQDRQRACSASPNRQGSNKNHPEAKERQELCKGL